MIMELRSNTNGFFMNMFLYFSLSWILVGAVLNKDGPITLPKKTQITTQSHTSGPSLVNIFKLLEPDKRAAIRKHQTLVVPIKTRNAKVLPVMRQTANGKSPVSKLKPLAAYTAMTNRGIQVGKNKKRVLVPLKLPPVKLPGILTPQQLQATKNKFPFKGFIPDASPKRQMLWYPGQEDSDSLPMKRIQQGLERAYQVEKQQSLTNPERIMPLYPPVGKEMYSKLAAIDYMKKKLVTTPPNPHVGNSFIPHKVQQPADSTGYLKSLQPIGARERLPANARTKQYPALDKRQSLGTPQSMPLLPSGNFAEKSSNPREATQKDSNRVYSSSLEAADTEKPDHKYSKPDTRWENIQRGQAERWKEYQQNRDQRWKNYAAADNNAGTDHYDSGTAKQLDPASRDASSAQRSPKPYREGIFDLNFETRGSNKDNRYDYTSPAKSEKTNFDRNTEELQPGELQALIDNAGSKLKTGRQGKIVKIEVVDKPNTEGTTSDKADKEVEKPEIPTDDKNNRPSNKPDETLGKQGKPLGEQEKPDKPVGELGKPDKPVGEVGKPDKPAGELGKPDKPIDDLGKPDKPVGELDKPDKPVGELDKPDKSVCESDKPDKPVGELGKPDKPVGELGKPDKPVGELDKPDKPVGEVGKPDKPVGELGKPDKPVCESDKPDKPVGELGKPDKPVGELGKPDKPIGELGKPDKPVGELGKPDKPIGEPGKPDKPIGEPGKPDKPIGEPGKPDKPVGELGKPDKPVGELDKPDKSVCESDKPDKPVGELDKPDKPVGELGKPDKPIGELGKPDKPVGELDKPDKPVGESDKPDKPVGELGKPDKPVGELGKPDKPVGELGKPDKPIGELGKPDKPVGEIGKPDKPIGELGKPDKPIGELGKPDKPVGEIGKPDKPIGELGKPDKPIGELGKPDKPIGEVGKPDKPVGELGKPDKPIGELGKPDKPKDKSKPKCKAKRPPPEKNPIDICTEQSVDEPEQSITVPPKTGGEQPPETPLRLIEESLLNKMEQRLASVLSLMQYAGGLHTVEVASSGCDDPPAYGENCDKAVGSIIVDGEQVSENKIGFNIAVLDYPSFEVKSVKVFDTNMDAAKSQKMSSFLMRLAKNSIILVAVKGDIAGAVSQEVWDTLTLFGARPPFEKERRASLAFIGCRGECQVPWIQQVQRPAGRGPSNIQLIVGSSKEYITFGGSGAVVYDVIKTGTKSSFTMSEGYNAGLPTQTSSDEKQQSDLTAGSSIMADQGLIPGVTNSRLTSESMTVKLRLGKNVPYISQSGRSSQYAKTNEQGKREREQDTKEHSSDTNSVHHKDERPFDDSENDHKGRFQDLASIPTEAEADNEPFPEETLAAGVSFKPEASEKRPDMLMENSQADHQKQRLESNRKGEAEENKHIENAKIGGLEHIRDKYGSQKTKENKGSAQLTQSEAISPSKAEESYQTKGSADYVAAKNKNNGKPHFADVPREKESYQAPIENDEMMQQNEAANLEYQERPSENVNLRAAGKFSSQQLGQGTESIPKEKLKSDSNFEKNQPNSDLHNQNAQIYSQKSDLDRDGLANAQQYNLQGRVPSLPNQNSRNTGLNKEYSSNYQRQDGKDSGVGIEHSSKSDMHLMKPIDRIPIQANQNYDHDSRESMQETTTNGPMKNAPTNINPLKQQEDETLCKHCDVKPEVSFKLEGSALAPNPKIQCKGCNKDFKPVLDNMKLDMSVESEKVSSNSWKPMKDESKGKPLRGVADKNRLSGATGPLDGNPVSLQPEAKALDSTLCKHCDVKPEVSFKLEGSALEKNPKIECEGCNKDFKPVVDNIKLGMAVTSDKIAPTSWKTLKDEPKGKLSADVQGLAGNTGVVAGENRDNANQNRAENGRFSESGQPLRPISHGYHENDVTVQKSSSGPHVTNMFAITKDKLVLLHDQPTQESSLLDKLDPAPMQRHNAEQFNKDQEDSIEPVRQRGSPSNIAFQNSLLNAEPNDPGNRKTTNTTLADIIGKGMMALRESNIKIGLGENKNVQLQGNRLKQQQQPEQQQQLQQHQQSEQRQQSQLQQQQLQPEQQQQLQQHQQAEQRDSSQQQHHQPERQQQRQQHQQPGQRQQSRLQQQEQQQLQQQQQSEQQDPLQQLQPQHEIQHHQQPERQQQQQQQPQRQKQQQQQPERQKQQQQSQHQQQQEELEPIKEQQFHQRQQSRNNQNSVKVISAAAKPKKIAPEDNQMQRMPSFESKMKFDGKSQENIQDNTAQNNSPDLSKGVKGSPNDPMEDNAPNPKKFDRYPAQAFSDNALDKNAAKEPNLMEEKHHEDIGDSHQGQKSGWHGHNCDSHPEECDSSKPVSSHKDESRISNQPFDERVLTQEECRNFYKLPDRLKRKLSITEIARRKRNCVQKPSKDIALLGSMDDASFDQASKSGAKNTPQNLGYLDKNLESLLANTKDSPLINSAAAMKATASGFRPGYTTIFSSKGNVVPEKKFEEMPDASETFISRPVRPDFSAMPGETPSKTTDMAYYFHHKNEPSEKSVLLRVPTAKEDHVYTDSSNNVYDQGDILGEAENLLQKDYAMAYSEAASALNRRVDDEQRLLDAQRTALVSKRMLDKQQQSKLQVKKPPPKKPQFKKPQINKLSQTLLGKPKKTGLLQKNSVHVITKWI